MVIVSVSVSVRVTVTLTVNVMLFFFFFLSLYLSGSLAIWSVAGAGSLDDIHPIRIQRFWSFRTQPLEHLTPQPIKYNILGNPTLGQNLGSRNLGMRIGCK